mgnify:CR=1 FL=1
MIKNPQTGMIQYIVHLGHPVAGSLEVVVERVSFTP